MTRIKEVAEYIRTNLTGCKFVGISSDNEVFVEFEYDDLEMQNGAALRIKREFPFLSKVTVVIKPSIKEIKQMVDDLNELLEQPPKKDDLLGIGEF
jgi:hypothetical protein